MMFNLENFVNNIAKKKRRKKVFILGIDGPTASGKTTLANKISKKLKKKFNVVTFALDWTLTDRNKRRRYIKDYVSKKINFFYELEEHMHISKAEKFLDKIDKFNNNSESYSFKVTVENLYNRNDQGRINLKKYFPGSSNLNE